MKRVWFCLASLFLFCCISGFSLAQPDKSYFTIEAKDEAIAQIYSALLDREIEHSLSSFNPDHGMVQVQSSYSSPAVQTANLLCALGCSYSLKQSKYYQSPELLTLIQTIFESLQAMDGNPIDISLQMEAEMSAFIAVQDDLRSSERINIVQSINRRLDQLLANEPGYDDSRSMVWCGVMAMASRFNGNPKYQEAAAQKLKQIHPILFQADGQVLENGSYDLSHSIQSIQYLFLYRVMSGEAQWDESIQNSLKWATQLYSFHGIPLANARSQRSHGVPEYANLMNALTFFGTDQMFYNQIATRYLESFIAEIPGHVLFYNISHFLRGLEYHTKPDLLTGIPYPPYSRMYQADKALYYTVGKNYQTVVDLLSPFHHHGLQTWSYKGQKPVVIPQPKKSSGLHSLGIDSAAIQVDTEIQTSYLVNSVTTNIETLTINQNGLLTAFVFSNDTTTVIYRDSNSMGTVDWVIAKPAGAKMSNVENNSVQFTNTDAQLIMPPIEPLLEQHEKYLRLQFPYRSELIWFTFAGPSSNSVIQPVVDGVVLIQINEPGLKVNLVVNLDTKPFQTEMSFPGTTIPVPQLPAMSSKWLKL